MLHGSIMNKNTFFRRINLITTHRFHTSAIMPKSCNNSTAQIQIQVGLLIYLEIKKWGKLKVKFSNADRSKSEVTCCGRYQGGYHDIFPLMRNGFHLIKQSDWQLSDIRRLASLQHWTETIKKPACSKTLMCLQETPPYLQGVSNYFNIISCTCSLFCFSKCNIFFPPCVFIYTLYWVSVFVFVFSL